MLYAASAVTERADVVVGVPVALAASVGSPTELCMYMKVPLPVFCRS